MEEKPPRWLVAAALLTLWLVWGSTYLAVTWILPFVPPFALSAARFWVAAPVLGLIAVASGAERPTRAQVLGCFVVGGFLFLGGNGGTVFSQTRISSGLTAVVVGCVPLWVGLLGWLVNGERPHMLRIAGMVLGVIGVAVLLGGGAGEVDPIGVAICIAATLSWATGTTISRRTKLPSSILLTTALQMAAGAILLTLAAAATGQWGQIEWNGLGLPQGLAFAWLVTGGSIAALVAYNWLLKVTSAAVATTYAYVNPLVAIALGWAFGGEHMGPVALAASATIIAAVILTTSRPPTPPAPQPGPVMSPR